MALLLRPLYEHWLLEATQAPLPAWKRRRLARALDRDTALRCLAAELAEFSNEIHAPAQDKAPDLRTRVVARALEPERQRPLFPSGWVPAGGIALLLLLALVAVLQQPVAQSGAAQSADNMNAPAFPTAVPTPVPIDSAEPSPVVGAGASALSGPASASATAAVSGTAAILASPSAAALGLSPAAAPGGETPSAKP